MFQVTNECCPGYRWLLWSEWRQAMARWMSQYPDKFKPGYDVCTHGFCTHIRRSINFNKNDWIIEKKVVNS